MRAADAKRESDLANAVKKLADVFAAVKKAAAQGEYELRVAKDRLDHIDYLALGQLGYQVRQDMDDECHTHHRYGDHWVAWGG